MSGIYIPGIEMPKSCDVCPFMKTNDDIMSDDYRYMYCDFPYMGEFVTDYEEARHPDCPLGGDRPHGRTIDADEFLKRALGTRCFHGDYARMLEELVGESKTIIPAEGQP